MAQEIEYPVYKDYPEHEDYPQGDYPKGDYPKGDYPKGDYPKGDYPKGDYPKGDYPKGDYPKGDYPKGDYPKGDYPKGDYEYPHGKSCPFEITMPKEPLRGYLTAEVYEGKEKSNSIIRIDQEWRVKCDWWLKGDLRRCIGGYWCVQLYLESIGPGPEFVYPGHGYEHWVELDPCGDCHYSHEIKVPAYTIDPKYCAVPYKLVVGLTYRTPCKEPGPMAGFCKLGTYQFYRSAK